MESETEEFVAPFADLVHEPAERFFETDRIINPTKAASARIIRATPFAWRDPKTIPPRQWLYGGHFVRKYVTTTVAPGGLGKSSNSLVEALCMTSGRALLGGECSKQLRVWVWNGEDPLEETERRVAAIILHHGLSPEEDVADRLFLDSGRTSPLILATKLRDEVVVASLSCMRWSVS